MARKGYNSVVVYLDNFLVIGESQEACQAAFDALLNLWQNFGFLASPKLFSLSNNWSSSVLALTQFKILCTEEKLQALNPVFHRGTGLSSPPPPVFHLLLLE